MFMLHVLSVPTRASTVLQAWHRGLLDAANRRAANPSSSSLEPQLSAPQATRQRSLRSQSVIIPKATSSATSGDHAQRAMDDVATEVFSSLRHRDEAQAGSSAPLPRLNESLSFTTYAKPGEGAHAPPDTATRRDFQFPASSDDSSSAMRGSPQPLRIVPSHMRNPSAAAAPTPTLGPPPATDAAMMQDGGAQQTAAPRDSGAGGGICGAIVGRVKSCTSERSVPRLSASDRSDAARSAGYHGSSESNNVLGMRLNVTLLTFACLTRIGVDLSDAAQSNDLEHASHCMPQGVVWLPAHPRADVQGTATMR